MKLTRALAFCLSFAALSISYASQSDCAINALHCDYVTGLPKGLDDGRYIKVSNSLGSGFFCMNDSSVLEIWPDQIKKLGNDFLEFSLCADDRGGECIFLARDNYTITQSGNKISINPKYYGVDIPKELVERYKKCSV